METYVWYIKYRNICLKRSDHVAVEMNSLEQFERHFDTEKACVEYLFHAKWPQGFYCHRCGHCHAYMTGTRRLPLYECSLCHHQSSLTAGTIMEGSRTDLRKWLLAIFLISRTERGTNAVELAKTIHVTYKTAWLILRKIRYAISSADANMLLTGFVRVNSAVYGQPYNSSIHLHPQEHPLLVGASQDDQGEPTFLKMKLVSKLNMRERRVCPSGTLDFAQKHVATEANPIEFVTKRFSPNRFRRLLDSAAQMNKWINTTFHGLGRKHLQAYLDEFCCRLNLSIHHIPIFRHLTDLCVTTSSVSYFYITRISCSNHS